MRIATVIFTGNIVKQFLITGNHELEAFIISFIDEVYLWSGKVIRVLSCTIT